MKHYKQSELTTGYCTCCESQVTDLIIGRKVCTGCIDFVKAEERILNEDNEEDQDGEDNDNEIW